MKNLCLPLAAIIMMFAAVSCKKAVSADQEPTLTEVTQQVINDVKAMGFSTANITAEEGGYLVEGDIFIPANELKRSLKGSFLRVGSSEQFRTTNLVTGLPRVITVAINPNISTINFGPVLDEAIRRYNEENLQIRFQRVSSGANITFCAGSGSFYAMSGFPSSSGNPFSFVKVNARAIGSGNSSTYLNYAASIFAHELGHCIGFRHTDYADRTYSCGNIFGATTSPGEAPGSDGAINIPGTPAAADPDSWMLACLGSSLNRPFNSNDLIALHHLY